MVLLDKDLLTWLKEKFYLKTEVDTLLSNKSDTDHTHAADNTLSTTSTNPVANSVITNELNNKAPNNHASTDTAYGEATTTKYGHVKVEDQLSTTSTAPVQNRKIKEALDTKADTGHTHSSLSSTIISSNQNLNNYNTPGEYYCSSNSTAATLSNCPVTIAFHLSVIKHAGVRQILKTYATNNVRTYERNFYNNIWGNWYLTYTEETLTTDNGLMSSTEKTKLSQIEPEATKNIVDTTLSTNSNNAIANSAVTTGLNGKAPTSHASSASTYGLGTTSNYGHVKTINGLTQSSHSNGTALSAYQGKILKDLVDTKADNTHTHTGTELRLGSSGTDANVTIQESVNGKAPTSHASSASTYGLGTTSNYGHVKTINSLTQTSHTNGTALSAYQGKVLKDLIDTKSPTSHTHTGTELKLGSSGSDANVTIQDAVNGKSPTTHNHDGTYLKTGTGTVTSTNIANGTIVNDDIANSTIELGKLKASSVIDSTSGGTSGSSKLITSGAVNSALTSFMREYYDSSLRINIYRSDDPTTSEFKQILECTAGYHKLYAQISCDDPDFSLKDKEIYIYLNGVQYPKTTDSTGKTGNLNISSGFPTGVHQVIAFVRGSGTVRSATCIKLINVS